MKRRMRIAITTILGLGGACTWALVLSAEGKPASRARPERAAEVRYRWEPGTRLRYALDCRGETRTDLRTLPGLGRGKRAARGFTETSSGARIRGVLELTPVVVERHRVTLAVRLRNAQVTVRMGTGVAARAPEQLRTDLEQPSLAILHPRGHLVAFAGAPGTSRAAKGILRSILAMIQVSLPTRTGRPSWRADEVDPYGPHIAGYVLMDPADSTGSEVAIRKWKIGYLPRPAGPTGEQSAGRYRALGGLRARFSPTVGQLTAIEGDETLLTDVGDRTLGTTRTQVALRLLTREPLAPVALANLRRLAQRYPRSGPIFSDALDPKIEEALHRGQLRGATAAELLGRLAAAGEDAPSSERTKLALSLEALAVLRPQTSAQLGEALARQRPRSWKASILGAALALAGHSEAQTALVAAIRRNLHQPSALIALVPMLDKIGTPSPAIEALLRRIARGRSPAAAMAALALGSAARRLRRDQPQRSARLAAWAVRHLQRARTADKKAQWLLVLGNAGRAAPRARLLQLVSSADPTVRAAALWALRWQDGTAVDDVLTHAARAETDVKVRQAARRALGARQRAGLRRQG